MKTITLPELKDGEIYAGILLNEDGTPLHHVILLPGDNEANNWQAKMEWAKEIGGELPNRREQSLLFANCKQHFKLAWYWAGEEDSSDTARYQRFTRGHQGLIYKTNKCRARAVRRLIIE